MNDVQADLGPPSTTYGPLVRVSAAGLALADGMIHAAVLPEHFEKSLYMRILFSCSLIFLGMLAVALVSPLVGAAGSSMGRLTRVLGSLLMLGLIAGYLVSRTVGLPGFQAEWNDVGLTTVALEVIVLFLLLVGLTSSGDRGGHPVRAGSARAVSSW